MLKTIGRGGRVGYSVGLSIERSRVRIPPMRLQIMDKFVYPTLPESLGMLLVYPKRMVVEVKCGMFFILRSIQSIGPLKALSLFLP